MSAPDPLVRLSDVGKRYVRYRDKPTLLGLAGRLTPGRRRSRIWALRHCDLEIRRGEAVGVMGLNGAGKSTMLQILAGVTAPSEGRVEVTGRVAPLIQVGVGFHPELTGRDNIYVNATVLGLARREIDSLFDEIVEFAELADVIDTPVKFYSSGMYIRLGFSVAAAVRPDVLLVDEVLAVGDVAFQVKSVARMQRTLSDGAAMLLVSHNVHLIRRLCPRSVVLQSGQVIFDGDTDAAISTFYESVGDSVQPGGDRTPAGATAEPVTVELDLLDADGRSTRHVASGAPLTIRLGAVLGRSLTSPALGIIVSNAAGLSLYRELFPDALGPHRDAGRLSCSFTFTARLGEGTYYVDAGLLEGGLDLDQVVAWSRSLLFTVSGRELVDGAVDLIAQVDVAGDGSRGDVLRGVEDAIATHREKRAP